VLWPHARPGPVRPYPVAVRRHLEGPWASPFDLRMSAASARHLRGGVRDPLPVAHYLLLRHPVWKGWARPAQYRWWVQTHSVFGAKMRQTPQRGHRRKQERQAAFARAAWLVLRQRAQATARQAVQKAVCPVGPRPRPDQRQPPPPVGWMPQGEA
jgi:hypothetical protein